MVSVDFSYARHVVSGGKNLKKERIFVLFKNLIGGGGLGFLQTALCLTVATFFMQLACSGFGT